jgi:hypothetical protein
LFEIDTPLHHGIPGVNRDSEADGKGDDHKGQADGQ